MDKIYSAARVIALILAIASAFVVIPYVVAILLILGGIAAIGNDMERNTRIFLATVVLILGAKSLEAIPVAGAPLAAIFAAVGTALLGASIVGITIMIVTRIKTDWVK
jgi:hypothetical protein